MTPLALTEISRRLRGFSFPGGIDGVVGIASGGVVPAALVAHHLGLDLRVIALNYRDDANVPRHASPRLLGPAPDLAGWKRILLVDDVWVSGSTWRVARAALPPEIDVLPWVMKGRVDFALIRDVEGCVQWPWKPVPA